MSDKKVALECSFCGKSSSEVKAVIAGPNVHICSECVELCNDILREEQGIYSSQIEMRLNAVMEKYGHLEGEAGDVIRKNHLLNEINKYYSI